MKRTDRERATAAFNSLLRTPIQDNGELIPELRLVPFSVNPRLQRYYVRLLELGWRYYADTAEWFDYSNPDAISIPCGRFSYKPDLSEAWIQPPGRRATRDELPFKTPTVPSPIFRMTEADF